MTAVRQDCKFYRGHIPCIFHKQTGVHCNSCDHHEILKERIIIIKLGAIGDVIRTTPLLRKIRDEYPYAEITWITYTPEVVPKEWVNNILDFSLQNIIWLYQQRFDWLINLDKDKEAIALSKGIQASRKSGFIMNDYGKCIPMKTPSEQSKWFTGLWDDLNKANKLNYMEEIFSICNYSFNKEEYILNINENELTNIDRSKVVVGLNTGCGDRWVTRLWPDSSWANLAKTLVGEGYETILLGGDLEDEKNKNLAEISGSKYFGVLPLLEFFNIVNQCDIVVTQVTMVMHVAIALKKYLVLMNNIFNRNEFYLYDNGVIIEPNINCLCCFKQQFDNNCKSANCMEMISVSGVLKAIKAKA